jgi:putative inorganic carbon (HCO3(-)) transporter
VASVALARGLLLAAAALLPFHELTWRVGPMGLRPFETCVLLSAVAAAPAFLRCRREWSRSRAVDREVLAVVLLGLVSLVVARGPGESVRTFRLVIVEPAIFYVLLTRLFATRREAMAVVAALLAGGVAASLLGFVQLLTGVGPIEAEGVDRIRAAYRSPNNLALLLDRLLPLSLALLLVRSAAPRRPGAQGVRALLVASTLILATAMLLTYSVGGWLATGIAVALVVALMLGRRGLAILAIAGAIGLGGLLVTRPERVVSHLDLNSDSTSGVRVILWRSALEMLRDHPFFGVGLDNFVHLYNPARGGDYMDPTAWREPDLSHPHNLLLDWWLSLGVVGALLLVRLLVAAWRLTRRAWMTAVEPTGRALVVGLIGVLAATLVHGAIDNSFFLPDLAALWWTTYALLGLLGSRRQSS